MLLLCPCTTTMSRFDESLLWPLYLSTPYPLSNLQDGYDGEFDVSLSQGVLTVLINDRGSWVINKQGPNRQIWWSSPLSGPQRYEWRHNEDEWVHTRSDENLLKILRAEMLEVSGVDLNLKAMENYIKEKRL